MAVASVAAVVAVVALPAAVVALAAASAALAAACVFAVSASVFAASAPVFDESAPVFAVCAWVLNVSVSVFICCKSDLYVVDTCRPKDDNDKLLSANLICNPIPLDTVVLTIPHFHCI